MPTDNLLLVVDVQEQNMRFLSGKSAFLERVNKIIRTFQEKGEPVLYVKHHNLGSLYPQLVVDNDAPVFTKKEPSAFSVSALAQTIKEAQPKNLVVVCLT
ncbi:isochorismatase family protein, partial [Lactobacillus sp. XV13L]|nr:isochorismatase family protein [Lactobacillus sp. XV13L]